MKQMPFCSSVGGMKRFCAALRAFAALGMVAAVLAGGLPAQVSAKAAPGRVAGAAASFAGQVEDVSGAIIPGATVQLLGMDGGVVASVVADNAGRFRMTQPAAGEYRLAVTLEGFQPLVKDLHVGAGSVGAVTLKMDLASVSTSVEVHADAMEAAAPENNGDAAGVSASDMTTLPILDGDVVGTLSAFLDAGVTGESGPTLVVDGVEMKTVGVAPAAIERVTINQDPYSARFTTPGRGQIEIVTKSSADKFHGQVYFNFRDSAFDAKNYFETTKAPEQKRIYQGYLTGPVWRGNAPPVKVLKDTSFLLSVNRQEENVYNEVNAVTATGLVQQSVLAPNRTTNLSMKVAHQINDHHSAYVMYRLYDASDSNQGIGSLTLATAGYSASDFDQNILYHDDLAIGANKFNQFSLLFERNIDTVTSAQATPSVVVSGAFTGGGAQNDSVNTENNPNISDIFAWTHGIHQYKFGTQLPNMGRRVIEDLTNRQGTYTFANLAAYAANQPTTFSVQQGQTRFETRYFQPGAFFQDQIQATKDLTVSAGLRYDWQNAFPGTMNGLQPRLSLAYVVDKKHAMVVRVGSGLYFRRVGVNIRQSLARYEFAAERSLLVTTNLCYPNINACNPLSAQPPNLFNYQPDIKAPTQGYYGISVERQLTKKSTLTIGYNGYRGWHALRSLDINAPLPPFKSAARPNANFAQVLQLNSGGYQKSDGLTVAFRGSFGHWITGMAQYGLEHSDSNTQYSGFEPSNMYAPNAEWSRNDQDQRHRLNALATFYPEKAFNCGVGLYIYSPYPYSITTGTDTYLDGLTNARPAGVPRNSLNGDDYSDVEGRCGYTYKLRKKLKDASPAVGISLSSFNTFNSVNYGGYVGVISSPLFMQPTYAKPSRRMQLGVSYTF